MKAKNLVILSSLVQYSLTLNTAMAKEKPQVLDYAIYTMENANEVAAETGFAPLPEEEIQASVDALKALEK